MPQAPVQDAGERSARIVPRLQHSDHLAGADQSADVHQRINRLVRRAQPTRMYDDDHPAPRQHRRERDTAGTRRPHEAAGRRGQIDTAVASRPPRDGRRVRPQHPHR